MNGLKVALVTPKYWPLIGGEATQIEHLARGLLSLGAEPTVVSVGYVSTWPRQFQHHGVPVIRLRVRKGHLWRKTTAAVALQQWLESAAEQLDCICVSHCTDEAAMTLKWASDKGIPVALRAGVADVRPPAQSRHERRMERHCRQADAMIVSTRSIAAALAHAGYARNRMRIIPPGVADSRRHAELASISSTVTSTVTRSGAAAKSAARAALAELDPLRGMPDHASLTLCIGSLSVCGALEHLVEAWPAIVGRWPNARLWIVGDGPLRDRLAPQIKTLRLGGRVTVSDVFEDIRELMLAADLYIHPGSDHGPSIEETSIALLEAMATGLPVIATETAGCEVIESGKHGLLVPAADSDALAEAVGRLLDSPDEAKRLGQAAQTSARQRFSTASMVDAHLRLFQELTAAKLRHPPHGVGPSQAKRRVRGSLDRQHVD